LNREKFNKLFYVPLLGLKYDKANTIYHAMLSNTGNTPNLYTNIKKLISTQPEYLLPFFVNSYNKKNNNTSTAGETVEELSSNNNNEEAEFLLGDHTICSTISRQLTYLLTQFQCVHHILNTVFKLIDDGKQSGSIGSDQANDYLCDTFTALAQLANIGPKLFTNTEQFTSYYKKFLTWSLTNMHYLETVKLHESSGGRDVLTSLFLFFQNKYNTSNGTFYPGLLVMRQLVNDELQLVQQLSDNDTKLQVFLKFLNMLVNYGHISQVITEAHAMYYLDHIIIPLLKQQQQQIHNNSSTSNINNKVLNYLLIKVLSTNNNTITHLMTWKYNDECKLVLSTILNDIILENSTSKSSTMDSSDSKEEKYNYDTLVLLNKAIKNGYFTLEQQVEQLASSNYKSGNLNNNIDDFTRLLNFLVKLRLDIKNRRNKTKKSSNTNSIATTIVEQQSPQPQGIVIDSDMVYELHMLLGYLLYSTNGNSKAMLINHTDAELVVIIDAMDTMSTNNKHTTGYGVINANFCSSDYEYHMLFNDTRLVHRYYQIIVKEAKEREQLALAKELEKEATKALKESSTTSDGEEQTIDVEDEGAEVEDFTDGYYYNKNNMLLDRSFDDILSRYLETTKSSANMGMESIIGAVDDTISRLQTQLNIVQLHIYLIQLAIKESYQTGTPKIGSFRNRTTFIAEYLTRLHEYYLSHLYAYCEFPHGSNDQQQQQQQEEEYKSLESKLAPLVNEILVTFIQLLSRLPLLEYVYIPMVELAVMYRRKKLLYNDTLVALVKQMIACHHLGVNCYEYLASFDKCNVKFRDCKELTSEYGNLIMKSIERIDNEFNKQNGELSGVDYYIKTESMLLIRMLDCVRSAAVVLPQDLRMALEKRWFKESDAFNALVFNNMDRYYTNQTVSIAQMLHSLLEFCPNDLISVETKHTVCREFITRILGNKDSKLGYEDYHYGINIVVFSIVKYLVLYYTGKNNNVVDAGASSGYLIATSSELVELVNVYCKEDAYTTNIILWFIGTMLNDNLVNVEKTIRKLQYIVPNVNHSMFEALVMLMCHPSTRELLYPPTLVVAPEPKPIPVETSDTVDLGETTPLVEEEGELTIDAVDNDNSKKEPLRLVLLNIAKNALVLSADFKDYYRYRQEFGEVLAELRQVNGKETFEKVVCTELMLHHGNLDALHFYMRYRKIFSARTFRRNNYSDVTISFL